MTLKSLLKSVFFTEIMQGLKLTFTHMFKKKGNNTL